MNIQLLLVEENILVLMNICRAELLQLQQK